jgi:hypothetical protein
VTNNTTIPVLDFKRIMPTFKHLVTKPQAVVVTSLLCMCERDCTGLHRVRFLLLLLPLCLVLVSVP